MIIGLQSAPVLLLIWVEDQHVSWRTAIQILCLNSSKTFGGRPYEFLFQNPQDAWENENDRIGASNLSTEGILCDVWLMQLNNLTTVKDREVIGFWHEEGFSQSD